MDISTQGRANINDNPHEEEAMECMETSATLQDNLGSGNEEINEEENVESQFGIDDSEEDALVSIEQEADNDAKFNDDYEDEEDEDTNDVGQPQVRVRNNVRSKTKKPKDLTSEPFDAFDFGDEQENTSKSMHKEVLENLKKEAEKWMPANACNTAFTGRGRKFVCFDYPGVIKNKEKAVATLGGITQIFEAEQKEGKIELNFRPDDPFCKPTIGTFHKANNLLIKCKRRKLPDDSASSSHGDGYEYKIEVLGVITGMCDFKFPADYQYLPVAKEKDGSMRELLSDIILKFEDERDEYLSRDVPLYAPPFAFTRHERPAKYYFQNEAFEEEEDDIIGFSRKPRHLGSQNAVFLDKEIPKGPHKNSLENLKRFNSARVKECQEPLEKLFEKRPVWTKHGITANMPPETHYLIKHLLPTLAYLILSGPWRNGWCKFGYDPRKHPEAKHYQVIDFRLRSQVSKNKVSARDFQCRFSRLIKRAPQQSLTYVSVHQDEKMDTYTASKDSGEVSSENASSSIEIDTKYQYVPWKTPPYRNMHYQVCDIFDEEVQKLIHLNDGQEKECTERDGWCVADFTNKSRDIIAAHTESAVS